MIGKMTAVRVTGELTLEAHWDDGAVGLVDLAPVIARHANLAPLTKPGAFAAVRLSADGWSVEWPSGIDFGAPQLRVWAQIKTAATV
jgi:hypothetical protein